ncbi:cilia- and flagella-associated protein 65 [Bombina bombina]|uniref:cilia- and flagella-associated protein 65 n=1 Tax=Bombina bombina TaxID=8345 RepID=UPI00235A51ED|nr:cilia- and flagella-associated protein 65 [Bombina bombina]
MLTQVYTRTLDPFLGHTSKASIKLINEPSQRHPKSYGQKKAKEYKETFMGFEVCSLIRWHKWEPGKESCKTLTLKNVRMKKQKVKFSPPRTPYFSTLFPQVVSLNPGTSFSLPITFRPLEKHDYEDAITFETEEGSFSVALCATLLRHSLLFPETLQLPTCAAYDTSESSFVMQNDCDLQIPFRWDVQHPFLFFPTNGLLDPKCEIKIKVVFQPQAALVHNVMASCLFGVNEESKRSIHLTAIAKYPYLVVSVPGETKGITGESEPVLQFGPLGVGLVAEKHIEILNLSMVNCPFRIERFKQLSQIDCNFHCDTLRDVVPAQGKLKIPLQYRPKTVGMESVDYFHVIPVGDLTRTLFKVSGKCQGPSVSLLKSLLNFGLVNIGEQVLRTLEITNSSAVPAHYQFEIDSSESVFSFDQPCGILGPWETQTVKVTFSPCNPIPYYRRVACLIHYQDPLFLDLIGTCHSDMDKPAILLPKHLSQYRLNMAQGLTFYPPDILSSMFQDGKLGKDQEGALLLLTQDADDQLPDKHSYMDSVSEYLSDDFSSDSAVSPSHITASTRDFDFGRFLGNAEPLPFSLTNHTKGKVTVSWSCKHNSLFSVTPDHIDIPPLKSTAFRLIFKPSKQNTLYSGEVEGFIFYKVLRSYRNVEDATICPPWCITLRARGHTFELGHEHFVPRCVLDTPRAIFPPAEQNGQTQRTLLLQNTGTSILSYTIDQESCPSIQVKPSSGFVAPGSHQILLLRTCPLDTQLSRHCLSLQLNSSPDFVQEIVLFSRAEIPQIQLENEAKLFFRPTCVGTQCERSYTIKNCSRLPLHFEWKIQHSDRLFISVSPTCGIIRPNETMAQTWSFVPQEEKRYFAKTTVLAWSAEENSEPAQKSRYVLRISGEGRKGTLSTKQEQMDLGNILVGDFQSCDLLLSNDGDCTLDYLLSVTQEFSEQCDLDEVVNDPIALEIEPNKGRLPARTKLNIRITARPARRLQYKWRISYSILTPKVLDPASRASDDHFLCCVTAHGVYPSFSVVDVRPSGSASSLNRTQLWRLFSLDRLNAYLQRDPTQGELIYRVPTRHSTRYCPSVNTPVLLDFNFGAAPVGSEPFVAVLLLENNGVLPVKWDFLFPADQQIELEFWAETWEFDQSEVHQMRIQDNKLFVVSPKSGVLNPGQQQTVRLLYRHDFIGTDRLPVLLKVSHGREILLNFIGATVEKDQRYVHFTSTKHQFTPVAIGSSNPSKQVYELINGGSVAVIYEIQLDSLREMQEKNYHHPVFQCLKPRGEILPGGTAFVEWIFSPLEAKTYSVDVPIHILGGDSALVTFEGIGYDRHVLGDTAVFGGGSAIAPTQRPTYQGQVAHLSQQIVHFGDIPVFCKSSRLLFINNTSKSETILFNWYAGSATAREILKVSPISGVVQPGNSTHVVVMLQTDEQAAFYALDLVCEIFLQKALLEYEQELQKWVEEEERQFVEVSINEFPSPSAKTCQPTGDDLGEIVNTSQQLTEIRRYKTLPPIKNVVAPNPPASRNRESRKAEKEAQRIWKKPESPTPYQLHLSVTARSHHIPDFLNHFDNDFQRHFLNRFLKDTMDQSAYVDLQPETGESEKQSENITPELQEMASDIMATIIRSLLDEKHFHEALAQVQDEPPPYYFQIQSNEQYQNIDETPSNNGAHSSTPQVDTVGAEEQEKAMKTQKSTKSNLQPEMLLGKENEGNQLISSHEEHTLELMDNIKRTPAFACLIESILENTLQNIMIEANRGEVVLTTRPRVIALPPTTPRGNSPTSTVRSLSMDRI